MKLSRLALAVLALPLAQAAQANHQDSIELPKSVVTGNRLAQEDFVAPYASEIHNYEEIKASGAISIYDYLGRYSSVNVMPSSGNPYQQKLDMRGYGIGDGHHNIVVTLNGRRLNNIDMHPQLLSNIPLASVERIEIIKGSGSVAQGDGAMAGVINIVTRDMHGVDLSLAGGSHSYGQGNIVAGVQQELFAVQVSADKSQTSGQKKKDINRKKADSDAENMSADIKLMPLAGLELRLGKDRSRIEARYGSPISKQEFDKKPSQAGLDPWAFIPGPLNKYTLQEFKVDTNRIGASYELNEMLSFNLDHAVEKKESEYIALGSKPTKFDYRSTDFSSQLNLGQLSLVAGVQLFDGERKTPQSYVVANKTHKDNKAFYLQGQYSLNDTLFSAGVRREKVNYQHKAADKNIKDDHKLSAWDLGVNHQYSEQLSVFANISQGFQAPDIDRFFTFVNNFPAPSTVEFNGFIKPAKSKNFNLGANHLTDSNSLKVTAFYSRLRNEIYYFSRAGFAAKNTNLDKSHKYGLEIQDRYQFNEQLTGRVNYAWTVAKIDRENEGNGAYNGKKLPGVSAHSITAGVDYKVIPNGTLSLTQNWRSRAYAAEDFANNFDQKQKAFNTTDLGYSHQIQNFTLFAQVNNIFNKKNGLWNADDQIYPVNFTRTWYAGVRASF